MARVTVEDCLDFVENRFKLVLLASKRARQLSMGTEPLVEWENDKPTVVALREIEEGLVDEEMMAAAFAKPVEDDMPFDEDDLAAALHAEISRELTQPAPEGQSSFTATPQTSTEQPVNPFGSTATTSADQPATETSNVPETLSMEELLAKELAASSSETPENTNPFSNDPASTSPTSTSPASTDDTPAAEDTTPSFGIPSFTDNTDPSTDGDNS